MQPSESDSKREDLLELLKGKIENLRPKLLDLTRRNPLISAKLGPRTNSVIRVVDELPDVLAFNLVNNQKMRIVSLPSLEQDPKDEQSRLFQAALSEARLTDEIYIETQNRIDPDHDDALEETKQAERALKDRVRSLLKMAPHSTADDITVVQHAKNNDISAAYDLPTPHHQHEDGRHQDTDIQTLLFPDDLERKINSILNKCRTWAQETGINVMHAAFGFLEWKEPSGQVACFAPLVLISVDVEKIKRPEGPEFCVKGIGEQPETNLVLAEKLKRDHGVDLPTFEGGSIEDYMKLVADSSPPSLGFKIRRQVVFGVFPSARMAMFHDLDTANNAFDQSDLLRGLFVGSENSEVLPFAEDYEVDAPEVEKKVPNLVLDADSSQYSTLVDVADGKNIALEGPPGTGKSQTIVNAIAAALGTGKKVLFVAEKLAALDVVRSRLEAVGLGEFVLTLQADRSTREGVIKSVRERVEIETRFNSRAYETKAENFAEYRSELAEYVNILSKQFGEAGLSVYEVLGKSIATQHFLVPLPIDIQRLDIPNVENLSYSDHMKIRERLKRIEFTWAKSDERTSFWKGHTVQSIDKFSVDKICDTVLLTAKAYRDVEDVGLKLSALGVDATDDPEQLNILKKATDDLEVIQPDVDVDLVDVVSETGNFRRLQVFLNQWKEVRKLHDELSLSLENPVDPAWEGKLAGLQQVCMEGDFESLDIEHLRSLERIKVRQKNLWASCGSGSLPSV